MSALSYGYNFRWGNSEISSTGYPTAAMRDQRFAEGLVVMGWTEPRWWQIDRWGEHRPPENVLAIWRDLKERDLTP